MACFEGVRMIKRRAVHSSPFKGEVGRGMVFRSTFHNGGTLE
jgi:hypothetical protein